MRTFLLMGCLLRIASTFGVQAQDLYDATETYKLRQFLRQESAEPGVPNYRQLGIESMDAIDWEEVDGLKWNDNTFLLEHVSWTGKNLSGHIDFSNFLSLQILDCERNAIKSVDVRGAVSLKMINLYGNLLDAIDVTTNNQLAYLRVTNNNISEIDLSNNPELTFLCCTSNQVRSLDFSGNKKMVTIYCLNNQISYINVQNCPMLKELLCRENKLTEIDISNKAYLFNFTCAWNSLPAINAVNCPALKSFDCSNNLLDTLDLSGCAALETVKCDNNKLRKVYLNDCLQLETFSGNDNLLDSLELPDSPYLSVIRCKGNNMDFCTLPPILPSYTEYVYLPQHSRAVEQVVDSVDLSRYYEFDGVVSRYTWNDGLYLIKNDKYEMKENGVFAFTDETLIGKELICRIENNTFPKLVIHYDVTIKSREDVSNANPEAVPAVAVYAGRGFVHVLVAVSSADIGIYSIGGACVYYNRVKEGRNDIPLTPGMYVATVSGGESKVLHVR